MKRALLIACIVASSACAVPASVGGRSTAQLTAPGVQALHKVEVLKALDVVRDVAIDGEAAKVVPTATAAIVVKTHKGILEVMKQVDWKSGVLTALDQLKADIPVADRAQFIPYIDSSISIIKAVIQ